MRRLAPLLWILLQGCAQPPIQEVDLAAERVARAEVEGASAYAVKTLGEAESALSRAQEALSYRRRYREAIRLAARACLLADEARETAVTEKAKAARQTDRFIRECRALMDEARYQGGAAGGLTDLESFATRYDTVVAALEEGRVSEAHQSASQLKTELLDWLRKLQQGRPEVNE